MRAPVQAMAGYPPPFPDPFAGLNTKPLVFEKLKAADTKAAPEAMSLEVLRELTSARRFSCSKERAHPDQPGAAQHVAYFHKYLTIAYPFLNNKDGIFASLKSQWTSPLGGSGSKMHTLSGLAQEHAMATFQFATLLLDLGLIAAAEASCMGDGEVDGKAARLQDAVNELRRAAGVFEHLAQKALPLVLVGLAGERPTELAPSVAACMQQLCTAHAQTLAAQRAELQGKSAGTLVTLHVGAADCLEAAAKTLKAGMTEYNSLLDRLRRYLAICSSLASCRAYRALARQLLETDSAGQAERCAISSMELARECRALTDTDKYWKATAVAEYDTSEAVRARCEKARTIVTMERLAPSAPPLTDGKVIAKPIPYVPGPQPGEQPVAANAAFALP